MVYSTLQAAWYVRHSYLDIRKNFLYNNGLRGPWRRQKNNLVPNFQFQCEFGTKPVKGGAGPT